MSLLCRKVIGVMTEVKVFIVKFYVAGSTTFHQHQ